LTGSAGSKKILNQNDVVLVKKQNSTGCNRILDQVLPGHTGFFLTLLFLQPGPIPAPDQPGPASIRQAGLQNYEKISEIKFKQL
jgi:hypothetical protein